jgi:hypothetical protein
MKKRIWKWRAWETGHWRLEWKCGGGVELLVQAQKFIWARIEINNVWFDTSCRSVKATTSRTRVRGARKSETIMSFKPYTSQQTHRAFSPYRLDKLSLSMPTNYSPPLTISGLPLALLSRDAWLRNLSCSIQRVFEAHLHFAGVYKLRSTTTSHSGALAHLLSAISQLL